MANPAELLFNQFTEWNKPAESAQKARKDTPDLAIHRRAIHNLNDINHLLRHMENEGKRVRVYKEAFPRWVKTVFNYPDYWQGSKSAAIVQKDIDYLENLIDVLDPFVPKLDAGSFEGVRSHLEQIESLLNEDDSLDPLSRESAREVVANVREAIDNFEIFGDFRTEKLLQLLLGQLAVLTLRSSRREKWKTVLNGFVIPYLVAQLPSLSQSGIVEAITQGGAG